ncbi:protein timeless homolog isoform X2 [Athalia rosae]|uniref:protein timeless homolog isoform X2 n=1 Tax=Athalia rosae TaxID=37344 RepID=UPI002033D07D|nr:protein timeless homolog isoform X2 [Athalia rosae]
MDYQSAEIVATCAALGHYNGIKYQLDKDCVQTLKDLIRYLKRDDHNHTIRRYLGASKVLQTDLMRILIDHSDKKELFEVLLRLLINLTEPAFLLYNEQVPKNSTERNYYLQIISHLQNYKMALGDDTFWSVIHQKVASIFKIPEDERSEDKSQDIQRILILVRNVLQVPADTDNEKRTDSECTVHDAVLFALHTSGMVDMFLFIASNQHEQQYQMHILEIVSLMLREQNATKLGATGLQKTTAERERDETHLLTVRKQEIRQKIERTRKYAGSRHSRFGGTFVVRNLKAIGDNELICYKPFREIETLEFSQLKTKSKRPKNKLGPKGEDSERVSALSIRLFLKEFCVEFLNGAYNPVMKYARFCIGGGDRAQANDESYYLWAMKFFMEFNRNSNFHVKFISETMSTETFYFVQKQLEHYYEMMITDKKNVPLWSKRLHLALKAYQELLRSLIAMDNCDDEDVRKSSKVIKNNVFYVPEYRETVLQQLLSYNEVTMSRNYLADIVETVHIFLKMLETFCGRGRSIVVQRIKAKRQKAKKKSKASVEERPAVLNLEERWDEASHQLSAVLQSSTIPEITPFDATLDTPIDDQKADAMKRVQRFLRKNQFDEAVGLLRAAREVWPENDSFGSAGITEEEEFMSLREIYFADLGDVEKEEEVTTFGGSRDGDMENDAEYGNSENEDEDEAEEAERRVEETDFKFEDFLYRFVNVKVIKACALLLRDFDKNSHEVNHCTLKLLHRVAVRCKTPAMIFQASIFRTFQRILESKNSEHKELAKFAVFIIRNFAKVAEKNRKVFMELLFWKTTRDAAEIVEGYGSEPPNKKLSRTLWTEAEEDELRTLFMEHQTKKYPKDLVDWLLENIINDSRTRRGIIKKLKEMCLIVNSKKIRNEISQRLPKEWSEEEIAQLAEIWEIVKEDNDPVDMIHTELRVKRPKTKIKDKLIELGLAKDRKELRKKRRTKNISGKSKSGEDRENSDSDTDRESGDESDDSSKKSQITPQRNKRSKKRLTISKTGKQPTVSYTNAQLSGLLKDIIDNGAIRDALEWIKESLEDALEDRDEESTDGTPLVPITDSANAAMDIPSFQRFLRASGIEPPADEQESYWRIPANMLSTTIRNRIEFITDALQGKFPDEDAVVPESSGVGMRDHDDEDDDDDGADVFESIKKFFAPRSPERSADAEPNSTGNGSSSSNDGKIARKGTAEESEEQKVEEVTSGGSDVAAVEAESWKGRTNTSRRLERARALWESDSEDEGETQEQPRETNIASDETKRIRIDPSDEEETPARKKRRLLHGDVDEEAKKPKRRLAVMVSDDED